MIYNIVVLVTRTDPDQTADKYFNIVTSANYGSAQIMEPTWAL